MSAPAPTLRVLVIDDDSVMRELLSAVLSAEGHTVVTVENGDAALQNLQAGTSVDAILSDIQLPGLSGAALAGELRKATSQTSLLAMSGSQPAPEVLGAFDGFLLKPFSPSDFATAVAAARQAAPQSAMASSASASTPTATGISALDETTYNRMSQSLPPAQLAELYQLTVKDIAARLARMDESRACGDFDTFRREAHALKGGCSMVGAPELAKLAARAEFAAGSSGDTPTAEHFADAAERLRRILSARFNQIV